MLMNLIKIGTGALYATLFKCYSSSQMFFMNHLSAFLIVTSFLILSCFAMCVSELEQARADNSFMKKRIFDLANELVDSIGERKREAEHTKKLANIIQDLAVRGMNVAEILGKALAFCLSELKRKADVIEELQAFNKDSGLRIIKLQKELYETKKELIRATKEKKRADDQIKCCESTEKFDIHLITELSKQLTAMKQELAAEHTRADELEKKLVISNTHVSDLNREWQALKETLQKTQEEHVESMTDLRAKLDAKDRENKLLLMGCQENLKKECEKIDAFLLSKEVGASVASEDGAPNVVSEESVAVKGNGTNTSETVDEVRNDDESLIVKSTHRKMAMIACVRTYLE